MRYSAICVAVAAAFRFQASFNERSLQLPKGPTAYCNKMAGGSCNPKTGYWVINSLNAQQAAMKNDCVWKLSGAHGPIR